MAKTTAATKPVPFLMFDADQLIAAQQRNVDAVTSASQIVVDGAKAWSGKPGEFKPADQIAKAKTAYEAAVAHTRELTEIAVKAQSEAFGVLAKAMMANLDEMKSLAKVA
jgi:hypothetical protein